jgi:hypothetical protein
MSATETEGLRWIADREADVQGRPADGGAWFELGRARPLGLLGVAHCRRGSPSPFWPAP